MRLRRWGLVGLCGEAAARVGPRATVQTYGPVREWLLRPRARRAEVSAPARSGKEGGQPFRKIVKV